ncbi:MAG: hypothetical protein ACOYEP_12985 [Limnochordia bacterium]
MSTDTGRRNICWIEDASDEEFNRYLKTMQKEAKPQLTRGDDKNVVTHDDKNVAY